MAGFQLCVETRDMTREEVQDLTDELDFYEFDDVAPLAIWALTCVDDEQRPALFTGLTEFDEAAAEALSPLMDGGSDEDEDPKKFWRGSAEVGRALHLLAQNFRQQQPGAKIVWETAKEVFSPIEETDGGRRIANTDGFWDNKPGDWATVCADDLEGFARLVDHLRSEDQAEVRLLIFIQ